MARAITTEPQDGVLLLQKSANGDIAVVGGVLFDGEPDFRAWLDERSLVELFVLAAEPTAFAKVTNLRRDENGELQFDSEEQVFWMMEGAVPAEEA